MPANYVLLERIELNASAASVTFSNIPQTGYTDLKVVYSARSNDNVNGWNLTRVQFNTDTTAGNYNYRVLGGFGSTVYSGYGTQAVGYTTAGGRTANTFGNGEIYIPNYLGSTQKSYSGESVTEGNGSTYEILGFHTALWSGTAAINQIILSLDNSASFVQYSTFSLYGLAAVGSTPSSGPKATGGNVTTDGTYWYHTFLASGTFTPQASLSCDYLVVAGGASGGSTNQTSGGGGAGGLRSTVTATGGGGSLESALSLASTGYTVTVGAGGAAVAELLTRNGNNGNNSTFGSIEAVGGGAGGGSAYSSALGGSSGGSGGGGGAGEISGAGTGGAGTANQGYAGGNGVQGSNTGSSGGGGGSGGVGANATNNQTGGAGGAGVAVSISGSSVTYAGGGGGGGNTTGGAGGSGGGGTGGQLSGGVGRSGTNATANTGSGGGGSRTGNSGAGGSGIVIIRYAI
jgi:hypothetical protein